MAEPGLCLALEFQDNALSQHLAQFDPRLVERINAPDAALGEDVVFVNGDQLAECFLREPLRQDRVRRPVAREHAALGNLREKIPEMQLPDLPAVGFKGLPCWECRK